MKYKYKRTDKGLKKMSKGGVAGGSKKHPRKGFGADPSRAKLAGLKSGEARRKKVLTA